jgi:hypothetical protein
LEKIKHNLHLSKQLLKCDYHINITNHLSRGYKEVEVHLQSEPVSSGAGLSEMRNTFSRYDTSLLRWLKLLPSAGTDFHYKYIGLENALIIPMRQDKK